MKNRFVFLSFILVCFLSHSQVKLEGIVDSYLATDVLHSKKEQASEFVTNSELNQLKVNLGVLHFKAQMGKWNLLLSPAFGTYMSKNYASEKAYLRWIYEAQISRVLTKKQDLTLGVFSSPYTQESAKSTDHIMYSRSLAPEYVPYYINGIRWRYKFNEKHTFSFYVMNGWQHIFEPKARPAIGSLYEWKGKKWNLNYSTYWGNQSFFGDKSFHLRALNEVNAQFAMNEKWRIQPCVYIGFELKSGLWWQVNTAIERKLYPNLFLNARIEYYSDPDRIQITNFNDGKGIFGFSFGSKWMATETFWLRAEMKYLNNSSGHSSGNALYLFLNTSFLF